MTADLRFTIRQFLACAKLAIQQQFEYRFNLFSDTVIQPLIVGLVELTLWTAFFKSTGQQQISGFQKESYLAYALTSAFMARIATSWMYEFIMIETIETGTVNSVLVRPISFFKFFLGQLMGYKLLTVGISALFPFLICRWLDLPFIWYRLPMAISLILYYLILIHTIGVAIASLGFFFNRIHHITVAKNITLWMLTGEFFPLDIAPEPFRTALLASPFSSAVFRPVGYLTGRLELDAIAIGFLSVTIGLFVFGFIAHWLFEKGCEKYSGSGA